MMSISWLQMPQNPSAVTTATPLPSDIGHQDVFPTKFMIFQVSRIEWQCLCNFFCSFLEWSGNVFVIFFLQVSGIEWECSPEFDADVDSSISFLTQDSFVSFPDWISRGGERSIYSEKFATLHATQCVLPRGEQEGPEGLRLAKFQSRRHFHVFTYTLHPFHILIPFDLQSFSLGNH